MSERADGLEQAAALLERRAERLENPDPPLTGFDYMPMEPPLLTEALLSRILRDWAREIRTLKGRGP